MTVVDRTGRTNADYRAMWKRIERALTQPPPPEQQGIGYVQLRAGFPSHDDVFSATEIAASFDDVSTWDGWVEG